MRKLTSRHPIAMALVLSLGATLAAPVASAEDSGAVAAFTGNTMNTTAGGPGGRRASTTLQIEVHQWTSDEQQARLRGILESEGSEALANALRDAEGIGWVRAPGTVSYDLKFARMVNYGNTVQYILLTDRPLQMEELRTSARTLDFAVSMINFSMPPDGGNGEGDVIVGAELAIVDGLINVTTAGMNPLRFVNVRQTQ